MHGTRYRQLRPDLIKILISGQKEVSVLRDDIYLIIDTVIKNYQEKIRLLKIFLSKEYEFRQTIDSEKSHTSIIDDLNDLIDQLNLQDFNISRLKNEFKLKSGINLESALLHDNVNHDSSTEYLCQLLQDEKKILSEIQAILDKNLKNLNSESEFIKKIYNKN